MVNRTTIAEVIDFVRDKKFHGVGTVVMRRMKKLAYHLSSLKKESRKNWQCIGQSTA